MSKKVEIDKTLIFYISILVIGVVLLLTLIGFTIAAWVQYGNKPIDEIPMWALWLMWKGGVKR